MSPFWFRAAAILLAVLAVADPVWTLRRSSVPGVRTRLSAGSEPEAAAVRARLAAALEGEVTFDESVDAAAVVVIGDHLPADSLGDGIPVSFVSLDRRDGPDVAVMAEDPPPVIAGWMARLPVTVRAQGMAGRTSEVVLEHQGLSIARVEHRWTQNVELFEPEFNFVPPQPGVLDFSIVARPIDGEASNADNRADLRLLAASRRLKVFVYEPRASWGVVFARRAIESDPTFEVSGLTRVSRNLEVRSGAPPTRLDSRLIEPYDLVLVGAAEELSDTEVGVLDAFVRARGGAVVLIADRRPTGPYTRLLPARSFDEWLADRPQPLQSTNGSLRSAEFALPDALPAGVDIIATVADSRRPENRPGERSRAVVFGWPAGAGRFVFCGALDAWRDRGDGFRQFWRARIALEAAASLQPLTASVVPGMVSPGARVRLLVRLRPSGLEGSRSRVLTPEIGARVIDPSGSERDVRLWPASEPGVFEATFAAGRAGDYDVLVSASNGATAETVFLVREDAKTPAAIDTDEAAVATASGGAAAHADDLSEVLSHLRALPTREIRQRAHPARSPWWAVAFASLLILEWAGRRRNGAR